MKKAIKMLSTLLVLLMVLNIGTIPSVARRYPWEAGEAKLKEEEEARKRAKEEEWQKEANKVSDKSTKTPTKGSTDASAYNKVKATADLETAIAALPEGATNVTVKLYNTKSIVRLNVTELNRIAKDAGVSLTICMDSAKEGALVSRIQLKVSSMPDILLGGIDGIYTHKLDKAFTEAFSNKLVAFSLNHKENFDGTVTITYKALDGMKLDNLVVYSYDSEKGSRTLIENSNVKGSDGYIFFDTVKGGDFIVSDGILVKK